jgi:hypothetical protein
MTAEELQLGTDDSLCREIGNELVPEEMGIDPLGAKRVTTSFTSVRSEADLVWETSA